jgi:predicted transcriptional regulator of viral defense system
MKFATLVELVGDLPAFETGLLLAGDVDPNDIRRQLSLWGKAGRVHQLRRGLYTLAPPFQKVKPHPFLIANLMQQASYVSRQSALSHYGLIPEGVPVATSVTTRRPGQWTTPLGVYDFRHIKIDLLYGYHSIDLGASQRAFVATPEKALLDLLYLTPGADAPAYLRELRLQNLEQVDLELLRRLAERSQSAKLQRATEAIAELARAEREEYQAL